MPRVTKLIKGNIKQGSLNMAISLSPLKLSTHSPEGEQRFGGCGLGEPGFSLQSLLCVSTALSQQEVEDSRKLLQPLLLQVFNGNAAPPTPCSGEEGKKESWIKMVVRNE